MKIPGSAAIVTGASRGLGRAFSEELLKRGGKVSLPHYELNEHVSDKLTNLRIQRQIMNVKLSYYQVTP